MRAPRFSLTSAVARIFDKRWSRYAYRGRGYVLRRKRDEEFDKTVSLTNFCACRVHLTASVARFWKSLMSASDLIVPHESRKERQ